MKLHFWPSPLSFCAQFSLTTIVSMWCHTKPHDGMTSLLSRSLHTEQFASYMLEKTLFPVINLSWKFVARNHCEVLLYRITHHIFPNVLCDETAMIRQKHKVHPSCAYLLPSILNGRSGIQRYKHGCAVERCGRIMFTFSSHLCY